MKLDLTTPMQVPLEREIFAIDGVSNVQTIRNHMTDEVLVRVSCFRGEKHKHIVAAHAQGDSTESLVANIAALLVDAFNHKGENT